MKAALLIGNGLNRCYEKEHSQISWSSLLKTIANQYGVEFVDNNSFPLEYECLVNSICEVTHIPFDDALMQTKTAIAKQVEAQSPPINSVHHRFVDLPIDEIMTTNYDYVLERAYSPNISLLDIKSARVKDKDSNTKSETKYSQRRKIALSGKVFHHIHGEANTPASLCLGYAHYADYLTHIRNYVKGEVNESNGSISDFSQKSALQKLAKRHWSDLFFTHDVHIVGLTLDICEIDLWWILTYRAQLFHSNADIRNEITLYSNNPPDSDAFATQTALFERLHVKVVSVPPTVDPTTRKADYISAYRRICGMIEDSLFQRHAI